VISNNELVVQTYFIRYFIYSVILSISLRPRREREFAFEDWARDTYSIAIEKTQSRGCSIETND